MSRFGRVWRPLTRDFAGPSVAPSRCTLKADEHPVTHALMDVDAAVGATWRSDHAAYEMARRQLAELTPGDEGAEPLLRQAAGFISRASIHLAVLRCSCRIADWAHGQTVALHAEATRLLGATGAIAFEPTWTPLL